MAGASLSALFQPPDNRALLWKRVSENMPPRRTLPRTAAVDPLPALVEDRFYLLKQCPICDDGNDEEVFDRRLDAVQRRIRRLDERIIRTVAASTPGLLAQLRLLAAFYEESANGAGRRRGRLPVDPGHCRGGFAACGGGVTATNKLRRVGDNRGVAG